MFQIIANTPTYVWFILFYLIWIGWKSRSTHLASWSVLSIMPVIMGLWSFFACVNYYGSIAIFRWVACLIVGIWLGTLTVRSLNLKFDKKRNLIEIAGNWTPFILSLCIFSLRYFLGVAYGMYPEIKGNWNLWILENIATIISGMFLGRLVAYWQRFKEASHVDL